MRKILRLTRILPQALEADKDQAADHGGAYVFGRGWRGVPREHGDGLVILLDDEDLELLVRERPGLGGRLAVVELARGRYGDNGMPDSFASSASSWCYTGPEVPEAVHCSRGGGEHGARS